MYGKGLIKKINVNFKFYDVTAWLKNCYTHIVIHCPTFWDAWFYFSCNNFPFRAFVTIIYSTSTEVLLKPVAPLDSAVPYLYFEQINVFWTSVFDSDSIVFDSLSFSRVSLNCLSRIRFKCSFFWPWKNQYMVHGFHSLHSFLLWFAQFQQKAP